MHADLRHADLEEVVAIGFDHSTELAPDPDDGEEGGRPVAWWSGEPEGYVLPADVGGTIFHTLLRILALPSPECQRGALHGLGHLKYPGTAGAVAAFLAANPDLEGDLRAYAERVRAGEDVL